MATRQGHCAVSTHHGLSARGMLHLSAQHRPKVLPDGLKLHLPAAVGDGEESGWKNIHGEALSAV